MLIVTSSFSINQGHLTHPSLGSPVEIHVPKNGEVELSSQYQIAKNKDGVLKAYTSALPKLSSSVKFISAQALGQPYEFERITREDGSLLVKTTIGLYNKFYIKLAFFSYQAERIWNLVDGKGEKPVQQIMVTGRLSNKTYEGKVLWDLMVNQFNIVTWGKEEEQSDQNNSNVTPINKNIEVPF